MKAIIRRILTPRNIFIAIGLFFVAGMLTYLGHDRNIADELRAWFTELVGYNTVVAGLVFFVLAALSAILTFFTSTPLIPLAAAVWGKTTTLALLYGGWMLGAIMAYFIGYAFSHLIRRFRFFKKIEVHRAELGEGASFLVVLLFRLSAPAEIASYTLGLLRYPFGHYVLASLISDLPFALLAIYSSAALLGPHPMNFAFFMVGGLITISLFTYFLHRQLKKLPLR